MDQKKVLIVSRSFYPENSPRSFRTTELVKEMCRQGHDVTLVTLKNDLLHAPIEKEFGVKIKNMGPLKFKPFNLSEGSSFLVLIKRIFNRALLMLVEYPEIELMFKVKKALKKESGYDLMISIAVPHPVHWGVAWARTKKNPIASTWVGDCGDAYMGVAKHDSFDKLFYFKYVEKWFCRKADYISIPKIMMKVNYYPGFHHKIIEIPQGFRFEDVQVQNNQPKNEVPTFAFAGVFMRTTRNPAPLLQYLSQIKKDFKFIVYTQNADLLTPFKNTLQEKLEIRNYLPRAELLNELSKMDFLLNIGYDPAQQAPSKLIDYHLTGRPILSFTSNEVDKKKLNDFLEGDYAGAFTFENIEQYRIENVCKAFLNPGFSNQ